MATESKDTDTSLSKCKAAVDSAVTSGSTSLKLAFTDMGSVSTAEGVAALLGTPGAAALTSVDLSCCSIGPASAAVLIAAIQDHPNITRVDLSANPIEDAGAEHVAAALRAPSCQLVSLDLHSCVIHNAGATSLAGALTDNGRLTTLNLRANYLTDDCLPDVYRALSSNTTLSDVNLHSNDFSPGGWAALTDRLRAHPSVRNLGAAGPGLESVCTVS